MKVKAYTIPELIIVMVVSSFLVLSLWGGYRFVLRCFYDYQTVHSRYESLLGIDNCLRRDFYEACQIRAAHGKKLFFQFSNRAVTTYIFEEDVIIRMIGNKTDFFNFDISRHKMEYLYLGRNMSSEIESFELDLLLNQRKIQLFYTKKYDRHSVMNLTR